jgi:hypothetical protein
VFYLPAVLWLVNAPYGPRFRKGAGHPSARCAASLTSCRPYARSRETGSSSR